MDLRHLLCVPVVFYIPKAVIFPKTDVEKLVVGDLFMQHVPDEVFAYEVDQIRIVEPDDLTW